MASNSVDELVETMVETMGNVTVLMKAGMLVLWSVGTMVIL